MENSQNQQPELNLDNSSGVMDMVEKIRRRNQRIYKAAIIFIVLVIVGAFAIINWTRRPTEMSNDLVNNDASLDQPNINWADYPDYGRLRDMKKLELVKDFVSWTPESRLENDKIKNINIRQQGQLAGAYIYTRLAVTDKKLTKYDSFYLKINNQGGHLYRANSLAVPASEVSELLFPLEKVDYLASVPYDESRQPAQVSWLNSFQDGRLINVYTFISSWRPGRILDLSIYYDCQADSDCLLSL